jgi:signal transduction histidine kinase
VTNKDSGTGLGLAISHDIVEQHAGRIEATNNPEGGAIFTIWLPVRQKEYS